MPSAEIVVDARNRRQRRTRTVDDGLRRPGRGNAHEEVLVATDVDREMAAYMTNDHGLAGARRLGDVDAGRITT